MPAPLQSVLGSYGTGTSLPVSFPAATTAGNLLVCVVWASFSSNQTFSLDLNIPQTSGLTWQSAEEASWTVVAGVLPYGNQRSDIVGIFYAPNAPSIASGVSTTASATPNNSGICAAIYEIPGIKASNVIDAVASSNSTSGGTVTAGNLTATQQDFVLVAEMGEGGVTAGSGYTLGLGPSSAQESQYQTASAGSVPTAFVGAPTNWACASVAFKAVTAVYAYPSGVGMTSADNTPAAQTGSKSSPSGVGMAAKTGNAYPLGSAGVYPAGVGIASAVGQPLTSGSPNDTIWEVSDYRLSRNGVPVGAPLRYFSGSLIDYQNKTEFVFPLYYLSLFTSMYRNAPNLYAWAATALAPTVDLLAVVQMMYQEFGLPQASGPQIDMVGQIVGASRTLPFQPTGGYSPVLGDADYLTLVQATIARNQWDGTVDSIYATWNLLYPGATLVLTDNQDMTVSVSFSGSLSSLQQQMIEYDMILPRPQAVRYVFTVSLKPVFGFDGDGTNIAGFDGGHWAG